MYYFIYLGQKCFFERPKGESVFNSKYHKPEHEMKMIIESQYKVDKKYECFSCKIQISEKCWMCHNCYNFYFCGECYENRHQFKSLYANTHKTSHLFTQIF